MFGLSVNELADVSFSRQPVSALARMAKIENGRQSVDTRSIRTISSSHIDDESSLGSDSEINGFTDRQTDKYGFIGGAQQCPQES